MSRLQKKIASAANVKVTLGIGQEPLFGAEVIPAPYVTNPGTILHSKLERASRNEWTIKSSEHRKSDPWSSFANGLLQVYQRRVYRFNAERMDIAKCGFGDSMTLLS